MILLLNRYEDRFQIYLYLIHLHPLYRHPCSSHLSKVGQPQLENRSDSFQLVTHLQNRTRHLRHQSLQHRLPRHHHGCHGHSLSVPRRLHLCHLVQHCPLRRHLRHHLAVLHLCFLLACTTLRCLREDPLQSCYCEWMN